MAVSTVTDTEPWRRKQRIIKALQETHGEAYSSSLTVHGINSSVSTGTLQHFFWKLTSSSSSPSSSVVVVAVRDPFSSFSSFDRRLQVTVVWHPWCFLPSVQISSVASELIFSPFSDIFYYCWRLSFPVLLFFPARDTFGSGDSFFIHNASKIR
jgi:hypothetical protein